MKKPITAAAAAKLAPSKLEAMRAAWEGKFMVCLDELIAAGRGYELRTDRIGKTDALSIRTTEAECALNIIQAEMRERRTYGGTLKRIPASA